MAKSKTRTETQSISIDEVNNGLVVTHKFDEYVLLDGEWEFAGGETRKMIFKGRNEAVNWLRKALA